MKEPVRVLVAEDEPVSQKLLTKFLVKWGYRVETCSNGLDALRILEGEDPPTMAILDWMMPGMDGVNVVRQIRQRNAEPYIYLMLLTTKSERVDFLLGMESGADDYLTKPVDPDLLYVRLKVGIRMVSLQTELIGARESLRHQATRDPLTGLLNRTSIVDVLKSEVSRGRRQNSRLGVILADLDYFKSINDTHGHLAGDKVLREAASTLKSAVRPYDSVGRFGGEEFVIVLPGCNLEGSAVVAERLRARMTESVIQIGESSIRVTASLGVAATNNTANLDTQTLLAVADEALYAAKNAGRNCFRLAPAIVDVGTSQSR
ncbi:MAG: diguanylate cyclase [Acidobacteriota bacterium]